MRAIILSSVLLLSAGSAHAVLGEKISSKQMAAKAQTSAKATARSANGSWSSISEVLDGSNVKEFMDSNDVIFAVTWSGAVAPDLSALFGTYFQEYTDAKKSLRATRAMNRQGISLQTSKLRVDQGGHGHSVHGRAWIPDLMPAGVKPEDLQ